MKKLLLGLLCVCFLLSGCRKESAHPTAPAPTETSPTELRQETVRLPLPEQGIALEGSGNLLYIPNPTVEAMRFPELRLLGNGLLLIGHGEEELILRHISLENGELIGEGTVAAGSGTKLCIGSGEIGLCDRLSGRVTILDEGFRTLRTYEIPGEGDEWYLNPELDTVYMFFSDRGLMARNLETGETSWLVDNACRVESKGSGSSWVIFSYTDRLDQKTYERCLNLSASALETLPVSGAAAHVTRQGQTWLFSDGEPEGSHVLVDQETAHRFVWTDSSVRLLSPRRHLLAADPSGRNLTLFDYEGVFLSRCALPQNSQAITGSDFVWSGYWEGYFFTDYLGGTSRLMFWDVKADTAGEDLQMLPPETAPQTQSLVDASLFERAAQLSARFGVDIRIGEECALDYSHYDTYALTDPVFIRSALDVLEESLSRYPDGFFRQLTYGSIESIRIELVGGFTLKPGVMTHPDSIGAFAQDRGSYYGIVLDGFLIREQTLFHEFSHIIDSRLEWDALLREDALYDEEHWLSLQPEGFRYAMAYTDLPEELLGYMESGYFTAGYAMTYPTEDRAVLMEAAMEGYSWDFEPGSGCREKLQYYADCIRDCFDTQGWPEVTAWEQVLN